LKILNIIVENNVLKASPENCYVYQDIVDLSQLKLGISQFLSNNSLIRTTEIFDNFIQIPSFETLIFVPYSVKFWNDENTKFLFRTNFTPKLKPNIDILNVIFNQDLEARTYTNEVGETANPDVFEPVSYNELFAFNPNVVNIGDPLYDLYNTTVMIILPSE